MPEQQPWGAPQQNFEDAVFLHRDIDALVFKYLNHDSKAALRLVSKAVKRAVDKTVRRVEIEYEHLMKPIEFSTALLDADWDLEDLELNLDDNPAGSPNGMLLLGGIRGWANLKKLRIQYGPLDDEDDLADHEDMSLPEIYLNAVLSQGFLSSTFLESLDLSHLGLRDKHIKKLATLHWASNLKALYLGENLLGADTFNHIIKVSIALTILDLSNNEHLASRGVAQLAALTNLKELDLRDTGWTGQGFAELAHSLTNLTSLKAGYNDFSGIHRHVSELSMPSLKVLDFKYCYLIPAFFGIKLDLPSLETLNLGGNNHFCVEKALGGFKGQRLPSLKILYVWTCGINGEWLAEFVAAGHVVCPLLEELSLYGNQELGDAGMRALCNSPWRLKLLNIGYCNLGSEEIKTLAEGNLQWLQHLDVCGNGALKTEDLIALASTANMKNTESIKRSPAVAGVSENEYYELEQHIVKFLRRA